VSIRTGQCGDRISNLAILASHACALCTGRLWCTFECACVKQRRLPVAVAGTGVSPFQRRVRLLGSFTPGFGADGTLGALACLNLGLYLAMAGYICIMVIDSSTASANKIWGIISDGLLMPFLFLVLWLAGRAALSQQVRLASNARSVLRTMSKAATMGGGAGGGTGGATGSENGGGARAMEDDSASSLLTELPWLPAHDRRDALVVHRLLAEYHPDKRPSARAVHALAISLHTAARLCPAPGDASAVTLPLHEWLDERGMRLEARMSEVVPQGAREHVMCDHLPLAELRSLSWLVVPGARCALVTPFGTLAVPQPTQADGWVLTLILHLITPHDTLIAP
jgi:hypothetical protein